MSASSPDRMQLFREATDSHGGLITRIALSHEADPALRRELVQDILLAIWMALPNFRGEAALKTFVASIAQKRSISHVAKRVREPGQIELTDEYEGATTPHDEALLHERDRRLVESIQQLPAPQREAIVLILEGFTYSEIGSVLGISANAAALRCQRAKSALKAVMQRDRE